MLTKKRTEKNWSGL